MPSSTTPSDFVKVLAKATSGKTRVGPGHEECPPAMNASATVLPERATHQQMRTFNQQLLLRALHDDSPLSRADLARLTGLTRTSVGDLVGSLIDDGLIEEAGRGQSS